jgi:hypothetical protein
MLVDAIHEATGKRVYIKEVATDSEELRISQMVTQEELAGDSRNHCVPLVNVFKDQKNPNISYMVMPFLRPVDSPPFETVKEIIKFTDQILEVTVNHFAILLLISDIVRAWCFSTRKILHTGKIHYTGLLSRLTGVQRLRHEEPYDGCRRDVPPRIPPRHNRVQARLFRICETHFKNNRQRQILLHRLRNLSVYT